MRALGAMDEAGAPTTTEHDKTPSREWRPRSCWPARRWWPVSPGTTSSNQVPEVLQGHSLRTFVIGLSEDAGGDRAVALHAVDPDVAHRVWPMASAALI